MNLAVSLMFRASLVTPNVESACNAGNPGLMPGSGKSPGEANGYPLQYSCLEKSMDRGAWHVTVGGVTNRHDWVTNTFHFWCCTTHLKLKKSSCVFPNLNQSILDTVKKILHSSGNCLMAWLKNVSLLMNCLFSILS